MLTCERLYGFSHSPICLICTVHGFLLAVPGNEILISLSSFMSNSLWQSNMTCWKTHHNTLSSPWCFRCRVFFSLNNHNYCCCFGDFPHKRYHTCNTWPPPVDTRSPAWTAVLVCSECHPPGRHPDEAVRKSFQRIMYWFSLIYMDLIDLIWIFNKFCGPKLHGQTDTDIYIYI